jgi:hypothetical protein
VNRHVHFEEEADAEFRFAVDATIEKILLLPDSGIRSESSQLLMTVEMGAGSGRIAEEFAGATKRATR